MECSPSADLVSNPEFWRVSRFGQVAEVQQQTSIVAGELFDAVAPEEIEVLASVLTRLDARLGSPL